MNAHDLLEIRGIHMVEDLVPQDASVVDDRIDRPEGINGRLHDSLRPLLPCHAVSARDGSATRGANLLRDSRCRPIVRAGAIRCSAEVVDHYAGAFGSA